MTNPAPQPVPPTRLPVPPDRAVYQLLPTDFYPWTEVLADLERRHDSAFSAVMDVQDQQGRWARFVWVRGTFRGGVSAGGRDVPLDVTARALPRASVSLIAVDPLVAEIVWACRTSAAQPLSAPWPAAYDQLIGQRFHGALLSGQHCSFWDSGRVISGALPPSGMPCMIVPTAGTGSVNLVPFWQKLVLVTQRAHPNFSETWRQVSMQLSGEHPILDPFANEIRVVNGQLQVDKDANPKELRPAMLAAYQATLGRLGLRLSDIPAAELRSDEAWKLAGLEAK